MISQQGNGRGVRTLFRIISVTIFIAGTVLLTLAFRQKNSGTLTPARSFIATYVQSRVAPDGTVTVTGWQTRRTKADGEWQIRMHSPYDEDEGEDPDLPPGVSGRINKEAFLTGRSEQINLRRGMEPGSRAEVLAEVIDTKLVELDVREWRVLTALKREFAPAEIAPEPWRPRAARGDCLRNQGPRLPRRA